MRKISRNIGLFILLFTTVFLQQSNAQSSCELEEPPREYKFLENKGQWHENVLFRSEISGGTMFLEEDGFTFDFYDIKDLLSLHHGMAPSNVKKLERKEKRFHAYKNTFVGSSQQKKIISSNAFSEYYNYFKGRDQSKWTSHVKAFSRITYQDLYLGIDLKLYSECENLKYDLIVQPGSSPELIKMNFEGADKVYLQHGNLYIKTSLSETVEQRPYAYQWINGRKKRVPCKYNLSNSVVGFDFPEGFDRTKTLIIDPVLVFASYSGSFADNFGMTATYDDEGNLFSGGSVFNNGYPVTLGAYDGTFNNPIISYGMTDVFISKYKADGTDLLYSTYLGGSNTETVSSLITNELGELFLYGVTNSTDFPLDVNAYDKTFHGGENIFIYNNGALFNTGTDIYVAKFAQDGSALLGSTMIGGSSNDGLNHSTEENFLFININAQGFIRPYDSLQYNYGDQFRGEIMLDKTGNCYIATSTRSKDFPIVNGFDNQHNGNQDGVVFKFNSDLTNLEWSTFIGGTENDAAYAIKVGEDDHIYVTGGTGSRDFPTTTGALHETHQGGKADGFVARISPGGDQLVQCSYLGTSEIDQSYFLELDDEGYVYLYGQTLGAYPIVGNPYFNTDGKQFIHKLDAELSTTQFSTVFGTGRSFIDISPTAFLVDLCGYIYISGWGGNIVKNDLQDVIALDGMPTTPDALFQNSPNGFDFYIGVFSRNAKTLEFGTFIGGDISREHIDGGTSRFDKNGIVYQSVCAGCATGQQTTPPPNSDFPTTEGAWSNLNKNSQNRNCNNAVFKFDFDIFPSAKVSLSRETGCVPFTVEYELKNKVYTSFYWEFDDGTKDSTNLVISRTFNEPGTYEVKLVLIDTICKITDTTKTEVIAYEKANFVALQDTLLCELDTVNLRALHFGGFDQFIWSSNRDFTDTLNPNLADSTLQLFAREGYYYVMGSNEECEGIDSVYVGLFENQKLLPDIITCSEDSVYLCIEELIAITLNNINWQGDQLNWRQTSDEFCIRIAPDSIQKFWITAETVGGCPVSDTATVQYLEDAIWEPTVTLSKDTIIEGESIIVTIVPISDTWEISLPEEFEDLGNGSFRISPDESRSYTITAATTGDQVCEFEVSFNVVVLEAECADPYIYIPNAFTPNGDGKNDQVFVRGNNLKEIYFTIYDRWGEVMFETRDQNSGWNGQFKGKKSDPAVYDYYLEVTCIGNTTFFKKGNITLIR